MILWHSSPHNASPTLCDVTPLFKTMRFYRSTDTNHQSRNIGSVFLVMCNLMDGLVPVSSLLLVRLLSSSATGSPCVPSVVTDVRWWCGCSVSAIPGSSCVWCSSTPRCVYLWRGSSCNCVSPRCPVCFALRTFQYDVTLSFFS